MLLKQVWVSLNDLFWVLTFLFCTVPVYDERKRQLKVPDELRKIPTVLKCYLTKIPQYSLALIAYTVSSYTPPSGACQDQLTANLNIQFAVVLHEPADTATASASKMKTGKDEEAESEAAGGETAESETAESEAAGSKAADSDAVDSEAAESDTAESEAAESEEAESD